MVNFKTYGVTKWTTNDDNTHNTNISKGKGNQAMKFGQLINCSMKNIFLQTYAENETRRLVPGLLLLFKRLYIR